MYVSVQNPSQWFILSPTPAHHGTTTHSQTRVRTIKSHNKKDTTVSLGPQSMKSVGGWRDWRLAYRLSGAVVSCESMKSVGDSRRGWRGWRLAYRLSGAVVSCESMESVDDSRSGWRGWQLVCRPSGAGELRVIVTTMVFVPLCLEIKTQSRDHNVASTTTLARLAMKSFLRPGFVWMKKDNSPHWMRRVCYA